MGERRYSWKGSEWMKGETAGEAKREQPPVVFRGEALRLRKIADEEGTSAHPVGAEEAWERFEPFLKRTGVTRVSDITQLDRIGIPVFNVLRPSINGYTAAHGKGFTRTAARLSAAGESLERWYATCTSTPSFRGTWNELSATYTMIPPERMAMTPYSFFHKDLEIPWTLGWDIGHQEEIPLPLELVRLSPGGPDSALMSLDEGFLFQCSSNGLSCGVHFLEAVSQALLEVVERDSVTASTMGARGKGIPGAVFRAALPETIPFPKVQELYEKIRSAGVEVLLCDNGTDVGVPTWNCYLFDMEDSPGEIGGVAHGMGSSLDHETAMIRAVTEAVQGRCVFLSGVRDIVPSKEFAGFMNVGARTAFKAMKSSVGEWLDMSGVKDVPFATFEEDVHETVRRLSAVGLDRVIVYRLSRPDDPVQAVKVVVPGAEGYILPYYQPGERGVAAIRRGFKEGSPLFRTEGFSW